MKSLKFSPEETETIKNSLLTALSMNIQWLSNLIANGADEKTKSMAQCEIDKINIVLSKYEM